MSAPSRKFAKKLKVNRKKRIRQKPHIVVNYERLFLLVSPLLLVSFFAFVFVIVDNKSFPFLNQIVDFLYYKEWINPQKTASTKSATPKPNPTGNEVAPPIIPTIDEAKPTPEIITELEASLTKMRTEGFQSNLIEQMKAEAETLLREGKIEEAKAKSVEAYNLAQEMYFAWVSKQNQFKD